MAVGHEAERVNVIQRRRVVVVPTGGRGGKQPYHFAKSLEPEEAENFIREYFDASQSLALTAVRELRNELSGQYRLVGCAVLLAAGRPLPSCGRFASHPPIHAAEGEFYREVLLKACEGMGLRVTGFRERDLDEHVQATFGNAANRVSQQVFDAGRSLGPPWTQDQKMAALAALVVLANEQRRWLSEQKAGPGSRRIKKALMASSDKEKARQDEKKKAVSQQDDDVIGKAYDGRLMRRLLTYLYPYKWAAFISIGAILIKATCDVLGPYLTEVAIDRYMTAHPTPRTAFWLGG